LSTCSGIRRISLPFYWYSHKVATLGYVPALPTHHMALRRTAYPAIG